MTKNLFMSSIRNNVLSLKTLKRRNYALYRYYINNKQLMKRRFQADGIEILNDTRTLNSFINLRLYLIYTYGEVVDLTVLRDKDRTAYNYISRMGNVSEVVSNMGLKIEYSTDKRSDEYLLSELKRIADEDNYIHKMNDRKLYAKVQYLARKDKVSVGDYLEKLGFHYGVNTERLLCFRREGLTYEEIAARLNISLNTVSRYLKKVGDNC